jgi:hypothetical protein
MYVTGIQGNKNGSMRKLYGMRIQEDKEDIPPSRSHPVVVSPALWSSRRRRRAEVAARSCSPSHIHVAAGTNQNVRGRTFACSRVRGDDGSHSELRPPNGAIDGNRRAWPRECGVYRAARGHAPSAVASAA